MLVSVLDVFDRKKTQIIGLELWIAFSRSASMMVPPSMPVAPNSALVSSGSCVLDIDANDKQMIKVR